MKIGARYRSQVCTTEVIVVRAPSAELVLMCGGHPMADLATPPSSELSIVAGADNGSVLGKRYTDEAGTIEVLVTKSGAGGLAVDGVELNLKGATPLPSSD